MSAVTDLTTALPIPEGGIVSKAILDLPGATKVVLFALDAGQEITPHAAPFPAELVALEGRLRVSVGDEACALLPHQAVDLPPGVPHGIVAQEPSRFMLTMRRGAKAPTVTAASKEEACSHHGCDHGSIPAAAGAVSNPTLRKWMAEHDEALQRLGRMEKAVLSGDWDGVKDVATWLFEELKVHNEAEEQHLFPLLDPMFGGGHGPTHCMREEHRLLWDLTQIVLGDIRDGVAGNPEGTARAATQLIGTLRSHIEKENNVLYPMAERMLDASTLARLGEVFAHA